MKKVLLLSCLLCASLCAVAQDANFYIYLCLGQSNMETIPTALLRMELTNTNVPAARHARIRI